MKRTQMQLLILLVLGTGVFCGICLQPSQHQMSTLDPRTQSYCGTAVKWKISPTTLDQHQKYDDLALGKYREVYGRWLESGGSNNKDPTNDCLGVLRNILCAYYYPICDETSGDQNIVCTWYCDYLKDRCPKETDLYDLVCTSSSDTGCAYSSNLIFNILLFAFTIALLL